MALKEKIREYPGKREKKSVTVSEFGETIWFTPITVREMQNIKIKSQIRGNDLIPRIDDAAFSVWTIIEKAQDENGNKLFNETDKPFLEQLDFYIVTKISNAMHSTESLEQIIERFKNKEDPFFETSMPSQIEKDAS